MRNLFFCLCILVSSTIITGCSTSKGFDRGAIKESMYSEKVITEDEIKKVMDLKPQIRFPFKLGVYFVDSYCGWHINKKWEEGEKDLKWLNQLKTEGIVSEIVPVTSLTLRRYNNWENNKEIFLKSVRFAAARHNVDAVLIIDYNCGVDRYNNYSSFLYLTIIGGYLVPGTHSDSLVIMNGALWDVRNEYLYLTAEAESEAKKIGPAFILDDNESIKEAKKNVLKVFRDELLKRMRSIKG